MPRFVLARPAPCPGRPLHRDIFLKPHHLQPILSMKRGRRQSNVHRLQEEEEEMHPRSPDRGATRRGREQGRGRRGRVERRSARAHSPIGIAWSWCWNPRQIYRESTRKGTIFGITKRYDFDHVLLFFLFQKTKTKRAPPTAAAAGLLKRKGGDSFSRSMSDTEEKLDEALAELDNSNAAGKQAQNYC